MPDFIIPKELAHLKIDERGYPVPFFVPYVNGKPNFRFTDHEKIWESVESNRCGVCGKKLYKDYSYIITGVIGMGNRVSSDAAMHRVCAEFALVSCPHMFYEKATRKEDAPSEQQSYLLTHKVDEVMLVRCKTKFKWIERNRCIFGYTYVSHEVYHYINGKLEKK
jgi:hypothetical protein